MTETNDNQQMDFGDFLFRCLLWGGLGYLAGSRGSKLAGWAILGPIGEQALGFTLEDLGAAMEQERLKKEMETAIKEAIEKVMTNIAEQLRQIATSAGRVPVDFTKQQAFQKLGESYGRHPDYLIRSPIVDKQLIVNNHSAAGKDDLIYQPLPFV